MRTFLIAAAIAVAAVTVPVQAQTEGGMLVAKGDRVVGKQAMLSFPKAAGGLTYTKSIEFSHPGENLDSAAQYNGPNDIWATVYVYRAGYPDAAIATFETERVINASYGAAVKRSSASVVPFAGLPNGAIRIAYSGAVADGSPMATASAFARIGGWVIKFRVSGTGDKQAEVATALDALIAGTKLEGKARVFPVALPDIAPCPALTSGPVKVVEDKNAVSSLFAPMGSFVDSDVPKKGENPIAPPFPANGLTRMCARDQLQMGSGTLAVLQSTEAKPETVIVMLSDAGDMVLVSRNLVGTGYTMSKVELGKWTVLADLDRLPDNGELQRLFRGEVADALRMRSRTTFNANGNSSIELTMPGDDKKK